MTGRLKPPARPKGRFFYARRPHSVFSAPEGAIDSAPRARPNSILRPKGALLSKALPSAKHSAPRARGGSNPHSVWGTVGPTILFSVAKAAPLFCREAALIYLCGQRPHFFQKRFQALNISRHGRGTGVTHTPGGGRSAPPFSFPRRSRHGASAPRRKCGVRRREPVGRATGVYSIKRGPHCAARGGEQRERAAGAVQETKRQGDNRGISAEMQCGTASRAARDLTGEPCSPVNPFFLGGGFWLGESASRELSGGVGGAFGFRRSRKHQNPRRFFSGTARRHHLFF